MMKKTKIAVLIIVSISSVCVGAFTVLERDARIPKPSESFETMLEKSMCQSGDD